jgi:serine/threonine-protein kinase
MASDPGGDDLADLASDEGLDFDDGEMGATSVGTELFKSVEVPAYPAIARIGRYEILGRLARGGMAEVYLARAREDDGSVTHVVVKRVLSEIENDPEMRAMFLDEGRTALRLFHPNVCHAYEVGEASGMTFLALEWVHGVSLRDAVRRAGQKGLPVPVVVHIASKVLGALEYVHTAKGVDGRQLGLVHQDVTPHNVMMRWTGEVKLLDFGIAKQAGKGVERGKAIQGKYEYMSPEQVRGRPLDARSDVFAMGVCLYEALTGRQLYGRGGPQLSMMAITNEPPPSMEADRPGISKELDAIVRRALAKNPAERWPSAAAMQAALEKWLAVNGHAVGVQRVAVALGTMFTPAEKSPLPPGAKQMTGTLQAMNVASAEQVLADASEQQSWSESFAHAPSEPPPPMPPMEPLPPAAAQPAIAPSPVAASAPDGRRWAWIAAALIVVAALGLAGLAVLAWLYTRGTIALPLLHPLT